MTKKKIMMAGISAALVATVGIGGTLAYLSATSEEVTNTVTIGTGYIDDGKHTGLYLDETEYKWNPVTEENEKQNTRTENGNKYQNLLPDHKFTKDPKVTMVGGSVKSYVYVKVDGVEELEALTDDGTEDGAQIFGIEGWNKSAWRKLNESDGSYAAEKTGDGYYVYTGSESLPNVYTVDVSKETDGEPIQLPEAIFETLEVKNVNEFPEDMTSLEKIASTEVKIVACAVQAGQTEQGVNGAFKQAKGLLDEAMEEQNQGN